MLIVRDRRLVRCERCSRLLDGFLEGSAGRELRGLAARDLDHGARLGIAARTGSAFRKAERAEANEANAFALGNFIDDRFEEGVEHGADLRLGNVGLGGDGVNKFRLVHSSKLLRRD